MEVKLREITGRSTSLCEVQLGDLLLYFSYGVCIAFRTPEGFVVSQNVWSARVGRHLNELSLDHQARLLEGGQVSLHH